jgi:hypothetical protein
MTRKPLVFGIALIGILLAAGLVLALFLPKSADQPDPNGYADFLRGAAMLPPSPANLRTASAEELRPLMAEARAGLGIVREGLDKDCRVPLMRSVDDISAHMPELGSLKTAGTWLMAESRLAALENRHEDAANAALDLIRLGRKAGAGGLFIDALVATALERWGVNSLQTNVSRLDARTCRRIVAELERLEAERESFDDLLKRERRFAWRTSKWQYVVFAAQGWRHTQAVTVSVSQKLAATTLASRETILALAARAYELEHGRAPAKATDLVPEHLPAVPKVPASGSPLELPR